MDWTEEKYRKRNRHVNSNTPQLSSYRILSKKGIKDSENIFSCERVSHLTCFSRIHRGVNIAATVLIREEKRGEVMIRIREGRLEVERNKGYDWLMLCYISLVQFDKGKETGGREWKGMECNLINGEGSSKKR